MSKQDQAEKMGKIIAKAWADADFKKRLLTDATAALKAEGLTLPEGVTVKALENTETTFHLVIPPKPSHELSDEEISACAGGGDGQANKCCLYDSHGTGILW
jgi:hypothetical protein